MPDPDDDLFGAEHVRVYRETKGERGYHWRGTTILLLTTQGRTSGEPRTTPLIHRTDGDRWVVVASRAVRPSIRVGIRICSPIRRPTIEVKAEEIPVRATTATGQGAQPPLVADGRGLAGVRRLPEEDRPGEPGRRVPHVVSGSTSFNNSRVTEPGAATTGTISIHSNRASAERAPLSGGGDAQRRLAARAGRREEDRVEDRRAA